MNDSWTKKLEEMKKLKLEKEIYPAFEKAKTAIVWVDAKGYDYEPTDMVNWLAVINAAKENPDEIVYYEVWLDNYSKGFIPTTLASLQKVGAMARQQQKEAYAQLEEIQARLESAETVPEIMSITWNFKE